MSRDNGGIIGPDNNPTSSVATGIWTLKEQRDAVRGDNWPGGFFVYKSYSAEGVSTATTTHSISTHPSGVTVGDLVLYLLVLDGDVAFSSGDQPTGFTFLHQGTTTGTASEYPDALVAYRIWDGTESATITSNESNNEPYTAALIAFSAPIGTTSITSPNYDAVNGVAAETLLFGASGISIPSLNFAFTCGRPTSQTPTLTYADADQIISTQGSGLTSGNLSFGFQVFTSSVSPNTSTISNNDTGRQILAGFNVVAS